MEHERLSPEVAQLLSKKERQAYKKFRRAVRAGNITAPFVQYLPKASEKVVHVGPEEDFNENMTAQRSDCRRSVPTQGTITHHGNGTPLGTETTETAATCFRPLARPPLDPADLVILNQTMATPGAVERLLDMMEPKLSEQASTELNTLERKIVEVRLKYPELSQRRIAARLTVGRQKVTRRQVQLAQEKWFKILQRRNADCKPLHA